MPRVKAVDRPMELTTALDYVRARHRGCSPRWSATDGCNCR